MSGVTASQLSNSKQSCSTTGTQSTTHSSGISRSTEALRNLIYLQQWTDVVSVCTYNPHEAKVTDRSGDLPLHEACLRGAPLNVIESLLSAYPYGVRQKGFCGRLPLHYAVYNKYNKPSLDNIYLLLLNFPEGISTVDVDGYLPIHLAVIHNAPKKCIETLIAAYPKSLRECNKHGNTPQMLAKNDFLYSILDENTNMKCCSNVFQKIFAKKRATKISNVSNTRTTKNKLPINTSRHPLKKSSRVTNTSNTVVTSSSLPLKKERLARTDNMKVVVYGAENPLPNELQIPALPANKSPVGTQPTRSVRNKKVNSRLSSDEKNVSRLIRKYEPNNIESGMNIIKKGGHARTGDMKDVARGGKYPSPYELQTPALHLNTSPSNGKNVSKLIQRHNPNNDGRGMNRVKNGRQATTGNMKNETVGKKDSLPNKLQIPGLPPNKSQNKSQATQSVKNNKVNSRLPSDGKNISRLIQKHEPNREERGAKLILCNRIIKRSQATTRNVKDTAGEGKDHFSNEIQIPVLLPNESPKVAQATRSIKNITVNSILFSNGKDVSTPIKKHDPNSFLRGMNRIRRRNLVLSAAIIP